MAEDDGMADRASAVGDASTTGHKSARSPVAAVSICGKRRHWTAEQKRQIVAESLEPGVSVATVVRRHGISCGQFYAWRQQLVLGGAIGVAAVTPPRLVGDDVMTTAPCREAALLAALPESDATPVAPVPPGQPDADIVPPGGVAVPVDEECGAEGAPTTNCRSALNSPMVSRLNRGSSGDVASPGTLVVALRRFRQGGRIDRTRRSPVPGQQRLKFVAFGAAGDQAFEHVGQVGERIETVEFCGL